MFDKIIGKLDGVKQSVKTVTSDGSERLDILKMGVESAWAEIVAAVQTATGPMIVETPAATAGSNEAANDASRRAA